MKSLSDLDAAVAFEAAALVAAAYRPAPVVPRAVVDTPLAREIAEHNAKVDREKAEKKRRNRQRAAEAHMRASRPADGFSY